MTTFSLGPPSSASRAVLPVEEVGPGVVVATWGDRGEPAHIVSEYSPGVQLAYFDNGPPPGAQSAALAAARAAAYAAAARAREEEELLLLPPG